MKPGDMIEWAYKHNGKVVECGSNELLWSSTMERYIPIGKPALLISLVGETYVWLTEAGTFHARLTDKNSIPGARWSEPVIHVKVIFPTFMKAK